MRKGKVHCWAVSASQANAASSGPSTRPQIGRYERRHHIGANTDALDPAACRVEMVGNRVHQHIAVWQPNHQGRQRLPGTDFAEHPGSA